LRLSSSTVILWVFVCVRIVAIKILLIQMSLFFLFDLDLVRKRGGTFEFYKTTNV
jgi:hypothetical protein